MNEPGASRAPASAARPSAVPPLAACSVAVLAGGTSRERDVSLSSGAEMARALAAPAPQGGPPGPRQVEQVEIDAAGRWLVGGEPLEPAAALLRLAHVDLFVLGLHGGSGEDGTLQGFLEVAGKRYTGSGVRASSAGMDKHATRELARRAGISTAAGLCFDRTRWEEGRHLQLARVRALSTSGWVLKPRCGGSSVSTYMVLDAAELEARIDDVLDSGDDVLAEARVTGVEVSCAVLGNRGEAPQVLTPIEIQPAEGRFFDFQQKYSASGARELCPPPSLRPEEIDRVRTLAGDAHAALGCDGYSRIDFIVPRPAAEPVLLEINTLPGFTPRSLLPQMAAYAGIDYRSLCLLVAHNALRRWGGA